MSNGYSKLLWSATTQRQSGVLSRMSNRLKVMALGLFSLICAGAATAVEPSYVMSVKGLEGGIFSRLEMEVFLEKSGRDAPFEDLESMPYLRLAGYEEVWGNEVLSEVFVLDAEFWMKVSGLLDAMDLVWLENFLTDVKSSDMPGPNPGPGNSSGSGMALGSEQMAFLETMQHFVDSLRPAFEDHANLVDEWQSALQASPVEIAIVGGGEGGMGCPMPFVKAVMDLLHIAFITHPNLALSIADGYHCEQAVRPGFIPEKLLNAYLCLAQWASWGLAYPPILAAIPESAQTFGDLNEVVRGASQDRVGVSISATSNNAVRIAHRAKTSEVHGLSAERQMGSAAGWVATLNAHNIFDRELADEIKSEVEEIAEWLDLWSSECMSCQHRVIAPRLEASSVRVRPYIVTNEGPVHWRQLGHSAELTAMARDVARHSVWEVDAADIFGANPAGFPVFNPRSQSQTLAVLACEGVVLEPDPESLGPIPEQMADTPYILDTSGFSHQQVPFFGAWPKGIYFSDTTLPMAFAAATTHRVCEDGSDGSVIDNDNDGIPEEHSSDACGLLPGLAQDPVGQLEEDAYLHPALVPIQGKTEWRLGGADMSCTGITLELVSKKGLTGKEVKTEVVLDVASYWTRSSDGEAFHSPQHPQDSTQIRFRITDDDWGKPRPHQCYRWDEGSSKWLCRARTRGCACVPERGASRDFF